MGFKDQIQNDAATFINIEEFGELHDVDGKSIQIVIDEDALVPRSRHPIDVYHAATGVYVDEVTFYAKASDFEYRPVRGQHITLDDELYTVRSCNGEDGILQIVLEANRA